MFIDYIFIIKQQNSNTTNWHIIFTNHNIISGLIPLKYTYNIMIYNIIQTEQSFMS